MPADLDLHRVKPTALSSQVLGMFMARAVADDCLAPKYIQSYKGSVDHPAKQEALEKAEILLSQKHGIVRLDNIWGTGGGIRPVKYLIKQVCIFPLFLCR